jgi:hypothetical protein
MRFNGEIQGLFKRHKLQWHSVPVETTRGKILSRKVNLLRTKGGNCQKLRDDSDRGSHPLMRSLIKESEEEK